MKLEKTAGKCSEGKNWVYMQVIYPQLNFCGLILSWNLHRTWVIPVNIYK